MKQSKIFAVLKKPNKSAELCLVEKDLKAFNTIVDGKREIIPMPNMPQVCIVFDGKGVASNKKPNFLLPEYDDIILGTVIIIAIDNETGFISLVEEQAEKLLQYLKTNDAVSFSGNVDEKIKAEYISNTDETYVYSFLSEVKTKYKTAKVKWLGRK